MATLWLDLETYNTRDISVGTYAYAETAGVLLLALAIDRGPVQVVDFTQTTSPFNYRQIQQNQKLSKTITDPHTVVIAHHAMFDRAVLREALDLDIPISQWRCSMAQAQAHALPAALSQLCPVLGLREDQGKLKEGKALIQRFCRPASSNHKAQRYSHESHPDEWKQFCEYARQDVAAMREAVSRMPTWNWGDQEIALWHLDRHINVRGFLADGELTTFKAFDQGEGDDPCRITASSILGIPPKAITKTQRNVFDKVPELALGYQGGVGAFQQFSNSYQVNMVDYWPTIQSMLDACFIARAHQNYSKWGFENDINQEAWLASEAIKLAWRDRHPATVALWHSCQKAAYQALRNPDQVVAAGPRLRFKFVKHSGHPWLLVGMPSKRFMAYFDPKMDGDNLSYMGIEKRHGAPRWERIGTYGGKLVENLCQSLGRDVLTDAMPAVEQAGYRIVLSVHDELVTEAPDTADYSEGDLSLILATSPPWAAGLPLAADGFEAQRYRKD